jgi:hypothetical protein
VAGAKITRFELPLKKQIPPLRRGMTNKNGLSWTLK